MRMIFFPCCVVSAFGDHCQSAAKLVADKLGVEIGVGSEFNCCGYPYKGIDFKVFILLSGRNLALAEKHGADLVTNCGCCYGTTKEAESILKHDLSLCDYVNNALKGEGLAYKGKSTIRHLLEVLSVSPGIPNLKARLDGTCPGLRVAAHYGCHLLRPSNVVGFDNPLFPSTLELLIEATGAVCVPWSQKLECCGAPLIGTNDTTSLELAKKKLGSAKQAKADLICTACPCCHLQFERTAKILPFESASDFDIPSVTYVQLIGMALGLEESALGVSGIQRAIRN